MFVDNVTITVKAGNGGDGAVAFRHEKYVPKGGPAGGDGGNGGSVILRVDSGLRTLIDFRYSRHFKAATGGAGMIKAMHGANAKDIYIAVPPGTIVKDLDSGQILGDLTQNHQELVVAQGGHGGRGNIHFANSRNTVPEVAENGEAGEQRTLKLELQVLADVGLVGLPSVGKSTLLSTVTAAKPKIAAYHFTTLSPNLGMAQLADGRDFVLADLPGLIAGASQGNGLGFQFLRHIERTRVILHLIEMDPNNGRDPVSDYRQICQELNNYDSKILQRPQIIVATKMDLTGAQQCLANFKQKLGPNLSDIYPISSITHQGLQDLMRHTADVLAQMPSKAETDSKTQESDKKIYHFSQSNDKELRVHRLDEHTYQVVSAQISELLQRSNLNYQDGIMRFARKLQRLGVDDALINAGAQTGDTVVIDNFEFEFI